MQIRIGHAFILNLLMITMDRRSHAVVLLSGSGITAKLDNMLDNAKISPDVFDSLGKGFRNLSDTVGKITDLTDATVATNDYAKNVKICIYLQ